MRGLSITAMALMNPSTLTIGSLMPPYAGSASRVLEVALGSSKMAEITAGRLLNLPSPNVTPFEIYCPSLYTVATRLMKPGLGFEMPKCWISCVVMKGGAVG